MRVGVVGLGYVGLITALVLAEKEHVVVGVDVDQGKVEELRCNRSPFYEPGVEDLLAKNRVTYTTDYSALGEVDLAFIAVSTPTVGGKIYLDHVFSAAKSLGEVLRREAVVVVKSTVVPGTARKVGEVSGRRVVSNPEFLREGNAINDTLHPDRVVVGSSDREAGDRVERLWEFTGSPVVRTSLEEAELVKYASNSFLAVKVSFINEMANLCEALPDCDVEVVARVMGMDRRIAPYFLKAGLGFGGSCFPKDTLAISNFARERGEDLRLVEAAIQVNQLRPTRAVESLREMMGGLTGRRICILGVAFKPETDDTRESVALRVIQTLRGEGAEVVVYDPRARTREARQVDSRDQCIREAEAVVIATEWGEFRGIEDSLRGKFVYDGRRVLDPSRMDRRYFRAVGLSRSGSTSGQG